MKHSRKPQSSGQTPRRKGGKPQPLAILHEDEQIFVASKPSGMWPKHALFDDPGVFETLGKREDVDEDSLDSVYPLEPDASGLMVISRDAGTQAKLEAAFNNGKLTVTYLAVVRAVVGAESGTFDRPLVDGEQQGGRVRVDQKHGIAAITEWRLRDSFIGFAVLECVPRTRLPYQIRAHLEDSGMPLAVDRMFGGADHLMLSSFKAGYHKSRRREEQPLIQRPTLHAWRIEMEHPTTGEPMSFEAPPHKDLRATLHQLDRFGRIPKS